jgi:hypothetical protein
MSRWTIAAVILVVFLIWASYIPTSASPPNPPRYVITWYQNIRPGIYNQKNTVSRTEIYEGTIEEWLNYEWKRPPVIEYLYRLEE